MSVSAGHQVLVSRDARLAPETAGHRVLRLAPACDVSLHAHVTMSLETETDRQTDRQTGRQEDRQTETDRQRETDTETERQRERQADRQRQTDK